MLSDDLNRVLAADYLGDLPTQETGELRAKRADAQDVERKLSFLRRLVQGPLDIVGSEVERRASGAGPSDLSDLVERLPQILAEGVRAPGPGRMPTNLVPPEDDELTAELDAVCGPDVLGSLPELSDEDVQKVSTGLEELETRVSAQRKAVFGVIDAVQGELARRLEQSA
jgi:hypothetical protein